MKTKELILETAKELISEVGYHKTTTASLAKRANISEGTIYRHFESKEDVLVHILKDLDARYARFVEGLLGQGPICLVDEMLRQHLAFVEENSLAIKIMLVTYKLIDSAREVMESVVARLSNFFSVCLAKENDNHRLQDISVQDAAHILLIFLFALTRAKLYWPDLGDLTEPAILFCRRGLLRE